MAGSNLAGVWSEIRIRHLNVEYIHEFITPKVIKNS